jgi:hypothetical protein
MKKTKRPAVSEGGNRKAKMLPYKNPGLPVAKRVKGLLSRMTLEEKAAQMMCIWQGMASVHYFRSFQQAVAPGPAGSTPAATTAFNQRSRR